MKRARGTSPQSPRNKHFQRNIVVKPLRDQKQFRPHLRQGTSEGESFPNNTTTTTYYSESRNHTRSHLRVVRKSSRDSCLSGNVSTRQHISKLSSVCSRQGFPPMALASRSFFSSPMRPYVRMFSSHAKPGSPFCWMRSHTLTFVRNIHQCTEIAQHHGYNGWK